jgi:hypothetical protein
MTDDAATHPMGHRTLVAYDRDGYDLHYAHWGVDPADITPETPFGGPPEGGWARERATDIVDPAGGRLDDDARTAIDPDPLATGLSFGEVCVRVDPLEHEALYVVAPDFSVGRYLVFALRRAGGRRRGALVAHDDGADAAYLRGWLAGARIVRDLAAPDSEAVVRALRWLDPARGAVVFPVDPERGA